MNKRIVAIALSLAVAAVVSHVASEQDAADSRMVKLIGRVARVNVYRSCRHLRMRLFGRLPHQTPGDGGRFVHSKTDGRYNELRPETLASLGRGTGCLDQPAAGEVTEYLLTENRVLRETHGPRHIRLNDDQRRRLAVTCCHPRLGRGKLLFRGRKAGRVAKRGITGCRRLRYTE